MLIFVAAELQIRQDGGTVIRESKAAKVVTVDGVVWGEGGARQYLILNFDRNNNLQQKWFKEVGNINDYIK
jgi:hypothetical protein